MVVCRWTYSWLRSFSFRHYFTVPAHVKRKLSERSFSALSALRLAPKTNPPPHEDYDAYMQRRKEILEFMDEYQISMKYRSLMVGKRPIKDPQLAACKNRSRASPPPQLPSSSASSLLEPVSPSVRKNYLHKVHSAVHSILYDPNQPWSTFWHVDHIHIDAKGHILVSWAHTEDQSKTPFLLDNDDYVEELKTIGNHLKTQLKLKLKLPRHLLPKITFQHKNLPLEFLMQVVEQELIEPTCEKKEEEPKGTSPT